MFLNGTHSKFCIGNHLSDSFPIKNNLEEGDASMPLHFYLTLEYAIR
jgi:hypothetical protein